MKRFDFAIQTSILLLMIPLVFIYGAIAVLLAQLVLGPWQYLGSLISVLVKAPSAKQKRIHLIVSTIYLLMLYLGTLKHFHGISFPNEVIALTLTVPAWTLGIYYYIITWRWTFPRIKRRGSFLPHLSF